MACLEPGCSKAPVSPLMFYCSKHNAEQVQKAHDEGWHGWCEHMAEANEEER